MHPQLLFVVALILIFLGCSTQDSLQSIQQDTLSFSQEKISSSPESVRQESTAADAFPAISDLNGIEDLAPQLLEQARQHYTSALEAENVGDSTFSAVEFEYAINILNELSYYPGIDSSQEFNDLSRSIIEDYEKYISTIDDLDSTASVFALREKLYQILEATETDDPDEVRQVISSTGIPLIINGHVERAVTFFQNKGREHFERYLYRSGRYFPLMRRIFAEEKLPEELVYLSMVESGVNPLARSWARAVGMWQFIKGTGLLYGLRGNWWYDERRNVEKSTRAAARHLRDLHEEFDDWYLALAAYNSGAGRVYRGIRRSGSTDFWDIRKYLPRETRNYVPLFISAAVMAAKPSEYGFEITPADELVSENVIVNECVDLNILAECAETDVETLRELNPELLRWSTPPGHRGYQLRIPPGKKEAFSLNYAKIPQDKKRNWIVHVVKKGEVLGKIARRYSVSVGLLMETNHLKSSRTLSIGKNLLIPVPKSAVNSKALFAGSEYNERVGKARNSSSNLKQRKKYLEPNTKNRTNVAHLVKAGETLGQIAEQYGVRVTDLRNWNDISYRSRIFVGETLSIWVTPGATTVNKKSQEGLAVPVGWVAYRVREGDSLEKIAIAHNAVIQDIKRWNGLRSDLIRIGQELLLKDDEKQSELPASGKIQEQPKKFIVYKIKKGDSLYSIAAAFGTSVEELKSWNNLQTNTIRTGQELKIYSENSRLSTISKAG